MAKGHTTGTGKGKSPTRVVAGGPGKSFPQQPMPGPTNPGPPPAMKKALAVKPRGGTTGFAGRRA